MQEKLQSGHVEFNFADSYKYTIAAYRLAELLGVEDMLPVYVERKCKGQTGSISWWLEKLRALKADELAEKTKNYLTKDEVNGVPSRRDKIVAAFQAMIAEKGKREVLY